MIKVDCLFNRNSLVVARKIYFVTLYIDESKTTLETTSRPTGWSWVTQLELNDSVVFNFLIQ